MGEYYEVTGTDITKYYGGKTAMRKGTVLTYLLSDHLGSNSLITSDTGTLLSETRFKAWGEVRYSNGTTTTPYTYTGQYSNTADFGWMYYKARWYDSSLGRFSQADTIVPGAGDPQAWDRFGYVKNNPVRYDDPSGHDVGCAGTDADNCLGMNNPKDRNGYSEVTKHTKARIAESILSNSKTLWNQALPVYRDALIEAGWDQYSWDNSDFIKPGVRNAYWYEDPVTLLVIALVAIRLAPGAVLAVGQYFCMDGDCGNEVSAIDAVFPKNPGQLMHIFRDAAGHFPVDNLINRDLLLRTVSPDNFKFADEFGKLWFSRILENGTEVWVTTLNGVVQNGGVNLIPIYTGK